ncbi:MAG: hypothetical protein CL430_06025 [Acidimicrobiaceae bacterium]|nr:hypothetical protein [Acidimicrobiaceae bacterium]
MQCSVVVANTTPLLRNWSRPKCESTGPPDPQEVADAIVRAVNDPKMPFRTLVGQDAELIDATKTSMSFEDFETTMRTALDWHD